MLSDHSEGIFVFFYLLYSDTDRKHNNFEFFEKKTCKVRKKAYNKNQERFLNR
jgi:hypothetical protein